jgi:UDP-N-acetylmuramyl tripeptide synthase
MIVAASDASRAGTTRNGNGNDGSTAAVHSGDADVTDSDAKGVYITTGLLGTYNVSNIAAALAVAHREGVSLNQCASTLATYQTQPGRMERFSLGDKSVILNMAKNPAGFNRSLDAVLEVLEQRDKSIDIYLVTNNTAADGEDIVWYRDIELERLSGESRLMFYVGGTCAHAMAERLRRAGIGKSRIRIADTPSHGLDESLAGAGDMLYIFANYSAVFPLRKELIVR